METDIKQDSEQAPSQPGFAGLVAIDKNGVIVARIGVGSDTRITTLIGNSDWFDEARAKRIVPVLLSDGKYLAHVSPLDGGHIILLSGNPTDTVTNFFLGVDFACDIVDHVLSDPYDAMVVVDASAKLSFISPVHEKFFGIGAGEAIGKNVRDVIPSSRLQHVVRTGVSEVGKVQRIKESERVVSRHAIRHDGKVVGAIGRVMFKGPQQVEDLARKVNALEQQIAFYKAEKVESGNEPFLDAIIGRSMAIESIRQQIRKIAPLDVPVLIQGASGTGKELVARALHMMSARHQGRLVTVNAAALPAHLVESELFGYEAGSFTGADRRGRPGKFEIADRGTIFLDEIGDMPLEVQVKLLRVLQDRVVERLGGDRPMPVDFRLCSATNCDLDIMVEDKKFRLDLFYRISPVRIILPSLEERIEDLPLLLRHFVNEMATKYARPMPEIDVDVPDFLMDRSWPGNIRQLRHEVERAIVFSENGRLSVTNFQRDGSAVSSAKSKLAVSSAPRQAAGPHGNLKDAVDQLEMELIIAAMARFKGNKKRVASHLGVSRSYLYKKLGEQDLDAEVVDRSAA